MRNTDEEHREKAQETIMKNTNKAKEFFLTEYITKTLKQERMHANKQRESTKIRTNKISHYNTDKTKGFFFRWKDLVVQ